MKALSVQRHDRYQSVAELQEDIAAYQTGFVTSAEQPSPLHLAKLWVRRHRIAFGVLAGFAAVAALFSVIVLMMWLELRGTASTFYDKSQALVEAGKFSEAVAPIDYAIRLIPKEPGYHVLRGHIHESLLRLEVARGSYERACHLDVQHKLARENLELCERLLQSRSDAVEFS